VNAHDLATVRDPTVLARRGPFSDFFEHLLSPVMRARRDGGPFACLYTSASLA